MMVLVLIAMGKLLGWIERRSVIDVDAGKEDMKTQKKE